MSRCSNCTAAVLSGLPYGEVSGRAVSTKLRMRDPARHAPTRPLSRGGGRVLPHVGPLPVPEVCHRTGRFHHITAVGPPAIPTRWPPRPGHQAFITLTSLSFPNIEACKNNFRAILRNVVDINGPEFLIMHVDSGTAKLASRVCSDVKCMS